MEYNDIFMSPPYKYSTPTNKKSDSTNKFFKSKNKGRDSPHAFKASAVGRSYQFQE